MVNKVISKKAKAAQGAARSRPGESPSRASGGLAANIPDYAAELRECAAKIRSKSNRDDKVAQKSVLKVIDEGGFSMADLREETGMKAKELERTLRICW